MSKRFLRFVMIVSLTGVFVAAFVAAASAQDLEDYLANADEAVFAGRQATWCSYAGDTEFSVVEIEHAGSLVMVESAGASQVVGGGRYSVVGESAAGIAISDWSASEASGRYTTSDVESDTRLGRDVLVITIDEGDAVRARIWFDEQTGAALGSEVYDAAGELFRLSWMLDFDPNPRKIFSAMRDSDSTYDVVVSADVDDLPDATAGYVLVDTYAGPDDSIHSFYADGLFSFSVFVIDGQIADSPFVDAQTMVQGDYRWILSPSDLWVHWSGGGFSYVLVGDLPPDHLEQVLADLPQPSQGNILSRLWSGLFG